MVIGLTIMHFTKIELLKLLGAYIISLVIFMFGSIWYHEFSFTEYLTSGRLLLKDMFGALLPILVHTFFAKKVWKGK